jgi:rubrerythrin
MTFESFEVLIEFAIEKEREAAAFYASLAQKTSFSGVKESLLEMEKEETKHESLLKNLKDNKAMVEEYNFKWIPDMKRSDYMVEMKSFALP